MKNPIDTGNRVSWNSMSRRKAIALGAIAALGASAPLSTFGQSGSTPKRGGRFRLGLGHGSTTDSLDPATYSNGFMRILCYTFCNHLAEITAGGTLTPELAESWEAQDNFRTWIFELRDGVEFHNGKTMNAQDVLASINYHRGEESKSAAKGSLLGLEDIKMDGDRHIIATLTEPDADFVYKMADFHLAIFPSNEGAIDWQSGHATGGYVLHSLDPGIEANLKRNPNYWKEGRAHFDEVEILAITDVAARTNALRTNAIDAMDRVDLKTIGHLQASEGIRVEEITGSQHYTIPMDVTVAPFNDSNVRLALKYAIDRQKMVDTVLHGHGQIGNDHPISSAYPFYDGSLEQTAYDPDRAKFYLQKSGLDTLSVGLHASDAAFSGAIDAAVLYQDSAANAGITIDVAREPSDGYWANVWMKAPWCFSFWAGKPTEDWVFSITYAENADWNETRWKNERFNELLVAARSEVDENLRREMYSEMQMILRDDGGAVIPMFANYVYAMQSNVQHDDSVAANWDLDGSKCAERWWYA